MSWDTSSRRTQLPPQWARIRRAVRDRAGGKCEWAVDGEQCRAYGTECDHIGDPHDHRLTNLRWLCQPHHHKRTLIQAYDAKMARRRRPTEQHPGLT